MLERKHWHESLTDEVIVEAVERALTSLDNPGFCLVCGEEADNVEGDACNYTCGSCGAPQVFGAQELLLEVAL